MKGIKFLKREQTFYLFLMISAYVSTLWFGSFYYAVDVPEVYLPTFGAFFIFIIFGIVSFFSRGLVTLFRLSILVATLAFYNQAFFTGGILSPALFEFVIPPLLAFFYRPVIDRYIFMGISIVALLSFYPLTLYGYTESLVNTEYLITQSLFCGVFVFGIIAIFSVLFRMALVVKNEQIGNSMKQLQETTQKLIQSEKMASLGILSAGVAHEINNPLNFIRGGVEVIEKGLKEKDFTPDPFIKAINEGLNRAASIVNSLNTFSRKTEDMDEDCDVHSILDNTIIMLRPRLKFKKEVIKQYDTAPAVIKGNEGKLHQAFLNLISNAEQAIDQDGEISIKTLVTSNKIIIELSDTGHGISKEHLNKISDPFFTTKPAGKGTGLGLAITYKIIEEHQGEISVTSKIGKGTKFTLSFHRP